MTQQDMARVNARITEILGERPTTDRTATPEDMNAKRQWDKARNELWKLAEKYGVEVITGEAMVFYGNSRAEGYTPKGKRAEWYQNNGYTRRSLYCGRLDIDGKTIFTSGTVAKCFEYILTH